VAMFFRWKAEREIRGLQRKPAAELEAFFGRCGRRCQAQQRALERLRPDFDKKLMDGLSATKVRRARSRSGGHWLQLGAVGPDAFWAAAPRAPGDRTHQRRV
jgi:hypothetical protein